MYTTYFIALDQKELYFFHHFFLAKRISDNIILKK